MKAPFLEIWHFPGRHLMLAQVIDNERFMGQRVRILMPMLTLICHVSYVASYVSRSQCLHLFNDKVRRDQLFQNDFPSSTPHLPCPPNAALLSSPRCQALCLASGMHGEDTNKSLCLLSLSFVGDKQMGKYSISYCQGRGRAKVLRQACARCM